MKLEFLECTSHERLSVYYDHVYAWCYFWSTIGDPLSPYKTLNFLAEEALQIAEEHGFKDATVGEDMALIHSEVSEAFEDFRAGYEVDKFFYVGKDGVVKFSQEYDTSTDNVSVETPLLKPCGIPSEMADVLIRVFHFCGKHKINIAKAVREKTEYNRTRPFKHGKVL